jgi:hypothetical protein
MTLAAAEIAAVLVLIAANAARDGLRTFVRGEWLEKWGRPRRKFTVVVPHGEGGTPRSSPFAQR